MLLSVVGNCVGSYQVVGDKVDGCGVSVGLGDGGVVGLGVGRGTVGCGVVRTGAVVGFDWGRGVGAGDAVGRGRGLVGSTVGLRVGAGPSTR